MDILNQYIGTGLLFFVKQIVDLIKPAYVKSRFAGLFNVTVALAVGIVLNLAFSVLSDMNIAKAVASGILSGFGAIVYNDAKKSLEK